MEVDYFKWEEFTAEALDKQIASGIVSIGFQVDKTIIKVYGKPEEKSKWTVFVSIEKDGSPKRTMSKKNLTDEQAKTEFHTSVNIARDILSRQRAS